MSPGVLLKQYDEKEIGGRLEKYRGDDGLSAAVVIFLH